MLRLALVRFFWSPKIHPAPWWVLPVQGRIEPEMPLPEGITYSLGSKGFELMTLWILDGNPTRRFYEKLGGGFRPKPRTWTSGALMSSKWPINLITGAKMEICELSTEDCNLISKDWEVVIFDQNHPVLHPLRTPSEEDARSQLKRKFEGSVWALRLGAYLNGRLAGWSYSQQSGHDGFSCAPCVQTARYLLAIARLGGGASSAGGV